MRIKNIKIVYLLLIIFFLFSVLSTVLMAKNFEQGKGNAAIHARDGQIKQSDFNKYTVYVKVSPADLIGVTVHISGEHYSDYKPGTDVTFYDVPEGDYSFRAVYGSMEASESGKYIGEDDTIYLKF